MTGEQRETGEPTTRSTEAEASAEAPQRLRHRVARIASVIILSVVILTPAVGFLWLRGAVEREAERSAVWHTQTMLIRHLVRTRGNWPRSWDDLTEDFEPTNKSYRTQSIDALRDRVEVDFEFVPEAVDPEGRVEQARLLSLKSGRLEAVTRKANRELLEHIEKFRKGRAESRPAGKPHVGSPSSTDL